MIRSTKSLLTSSIDWVGFQYRNNECFRKSSENAKHSVPPLRGSRNKRVTRVARKRTVDLLKFDAEYGGNTVYYVTGVNLQ